MLRIYRALGSFVAVVLAYWVYAVVAVPMIEPSMDRLERELPPESQSAENNARFQSLMALFPAGHWVLEKPNILESDRVKLLIQDYENLGDGKIAIRPCVMIFTPLGPAETRAVRNRQSTILEASEGALLEFDKPLDLRQGKIGRLVSGRLTGHVTIRSAGRDPGPSDDLYLTTQDVELTEDRISTANRVEFTYGLNNGAGSKMLIKLVPGDETDEKNQHAPKIEDIELFELEHLERLHLELSDSNFVPWGKKVPALSLQSESSGLNTDLPIEIRCRGPFRFDPIRQVATFESRVDVLRIHLQGPSDQLNCELLSLYFARPKSTESEAAKRAAKGGGTPSKPDFAFEPRRIVAEGNPVFIRSPQEDIEVRGDWLQYDIAEKQIVLKGAREVSLQHKQSEIHARSLHSQLAEPGRLGPTLAEGPGRLRASMNDQIGQTLEAQWNGQLRIRPHQRQQVVSLTGGALMAFGGMGQIEAEEIYFWLFELPADDNSKSPNMRPDRMMARRQVKLDSLQISGRVDQMEMWFESPQTIKTGGDAPASSNLSNSSEGRKRDISQTIGQSAKNANLIKRHFKIEGRLLRGRLILPDTEHPLDTQKPEIAELLLDGNVRLTETRTATPGEQPVLLTGDRIQAFDVSQPRAAVTVVGSPAHFEGHGLALTSSNINLNRGTNRLWIEGAGQALVPIDRDFDGKPLDQPISLDIRWQRQMSFDGKTVRFERSVTAAGPDRLLRTEMLDIVFSEAIRFDEIDPDQPSKPGKILCRGGTFMENQTFDNQRNLTSMGAIRTADLSIDLVSGKTTATGPGQLSTVQRGGPLVSMDLTGQSKKKPQDPDQLTYLHARFQDAIEGNLHHQEMTLFGRVQTTYGPIDDWGDKLDGDDPDNLTDEGVVLSCDSLHVTKMPGASERGSFELEAAGNTVAEGREFTARAVRMTYDSAKGLLILEGDGRTDAQLFRQGQPNFSIQKIHFWPETNHVKIDGFRKLELHQVPSK